VLEGGYEEFADAVLVTVLVYWFLFYFLFNSRKYGIGEKEEVLNHSCESYLSLAITKQGGLLSFHIPRPNLLPRHLSHEHIAIRSRDQVGKMHIRDSLCISPDFEFELVRFLVC